MKDPKPVLTTLHNMAPITAKAASNEWERRVDRASWIVMGIAAVFFAAFGIMVLIHKYAGKLSHTGLEIAQWLAIFTILLPIVSMSIQSVGGICMLVRFKPSSFGWFMREVDHDTQRVDQLLEFETDQLEGARKWLTVKSKRLQHWLDVCIGGSQKVAFLSLATMAWNAWSELAKEMKDPTFAKEIVAGVPVHDLYWMAGAFFLGTAIGAVFLVRQISTYRYQVELLDMTLDEKKASRKSASRKKECSPPLSCHEE